jgi:hypothetical protein
MAGVLSFSEYIGGPDQVIAAQAFPSDQRSYVYNFGVDVTGWTFTADCQTIVVDQLAFNRYTGQPNFANSRVIGSFDSIELEDDQAPQVINAQLGQVKLKIPAGLYTGNIFPDARSHVPVLIVSMTWTDSESFPNTQSHRWAFVQAWEPDVTIGDPVDSAGYTPL